jgi:hypothetical protein
MMLARELQVTAEKWLKLAIHSKWGKNDDEPVKTPKITY